MWLSSVARSCATQDDVDKDNVCTPTISPGINRPPHLRPSRIHLKLRDYETTLLDMVIIAGSPSGAWKILSSLVGESSEAAQERGKKEFEDLSFEVGKESMGDYIARAKAVVMRLEQNNVSITKKEINRRILNSLPLILMSRKRCSC